MSKMSAQFKLKAYSKFFLCKLTICNNFFFNTEISLLYSLYLEIRKKKNTIFYKFWFQFHPSENMYLYPNSFRSMRLSFPIDSSISLHAVLLYRHSPKNMESTVHHTKIPMVQNDMQYK